VKLAVVVQRYGETINGGAELHARYIAEHLAAHAEVEVLTTCATDYVSWRNDLPAGVERVNGVPVRRFKVTHERNQLDFGRRSEHVFRHRHSLADEMDWLEAEGPACPALVGHLSTHARDLDFCIFFSYRYYLAYHGARAASGRAILVPTAERDPAVGLSMFKPVFCGVRALVYNSPEERAMIQAVAGNEGVPSAVVGVGSNVPSSTQANRFRQKFGVRGPFAVYIGRIDENKGCKELFDFFDGYIKAEAGPLSLVLIGNSLLDVPAHPRIRHLGFLNDEDKFDALAAAELLVMPSYFESLSMVVLEAWGLGRPVLVNGRCDVLKGQCLRSDAGLYYDNELEFIETLRAIEQNRWLSASLGRNGRQYFREHYDWGVVERKYLDLLARLAGETAPATMEPLPGWLARRRDDCPAGADVVAALPAGPVVEAESSPERFPSPPPPAPRPGTPERGSPQPNAPGPRGSDQPAHRPGSSPPGVA
jgi:glycosyltransferase involved in cell wall biosynthesis